MSKNQELPKGQTANTLRIVSDQGVRRIRTLSELGFPCIKIAKLLHINMKTVQDILQYKSFPQSVFDPILEYKMTFFLAKDGTPTVTFPDPEISSYYEPNKP